ncbi:hypothetical protein LOTGIDRAFT_232907 [Lottia gigantea]|uniref:Uncharacterized protein n=1 Tax=Lottia gigantea TaxID=225164 RepID=V4BUL2_LOTGI|nr:hypothetical protein LOTGIDRAFT_232907 [Lottia gigantea]ESO92779.1 hypothetical protein LOTGIDRAFT_232907 [Lottia gigantea]
MLKTMKLFMVTLLVVFVTTTLADDDVNRRYKRQGYGGYGGMGGGYQDPAAAGNQQRM